MPLSLTPDDIAYFRQLDHDRERALAQGWTTSRIPVNPDHEKWVEYKKLEKLFKSQRPGETSDNQHAVAQSPSPASTTLMTAPQSGIPSQEQNMMFNLWLGAAANSALSLQAPCPSPHLWQQVMMHFLANGSPCGCALAHNLHRNCWLDAPDLRNCLSAAAPQYGVQKPRPTIPNTTPAIIEDVSRAESEQAVVVEDDDDDIDCEMKESVQICLILRQKSADVLADVDRDASANWISRRLLGDSGVDIIPTSNITYQGPDGIRLVSKGCVRIYWRRSIREKVFPGEFVVHAGKPGAPDVILGQSWARTHGDSAVLVRNVGKAKGSNAKRQSERVARGESGRMRSVSQSIAGHNRFKLPERHKINRRFEDMRKR